MDTNEIILKEEVYALVGVALEVLNQIGHGYHEKPYENAMVVEYHLRGIPCVQQPDFPIEYKGIKVGTFTPDLIAFNQIIVDAKSIPQITDHERGQTLNYLKATGCRIGLIINFKKAKLEWERIIR